MYSSSKIWGPDVTKPVEKVRNLKDKKKSSKIFFKAPGKLGFIDICIHKYTWLLIIWVNWLWQCNYQLLCHAEILVLFWFLDGCLNMHLSRFNICWSLHGHHWQLVLFFYFTFNHYDVHRHTIWKIRFLYSRYIHLCLPKSFLRICTGGQTCVSFYFHID